MNKKIASEIAIGIIILLVIIIAAMFWLPTKKAQAPVSKETAAKSAQQPLQEVTQTKQLMPENQQQTVQQNNQQVQESVQASAQRGGQPIMQNAAAGDDNSQITKAVTDAVNSYTKTLKMSWENKVDISAFDATKTAAKGKWWAGDAWNWAAWKQADGTWKAFAFGDGFKCGTDSIIPSKYNDFFFDIMNISNGKGGYQKYCWN